MWNFLSRASGEFGWLSIVVPHWMKRRRQGDDVDDLAFAVSDRLQNP
jgi:hypothetical protein